MTGISKKDLPALNSIITVEEIEETIKNLPNHKAPGPDWFPYFYFKMYFATRAPHMVALFNSFMTGSPVPDKMLHSFITVLPKAGKDPLDLASYRPIALLNSDLKIFTWLLAYRLNGVLPPTLSQKIRLALCLTDRRVIILGGTLTSLT